MEGAELAIRFSYMPNALRYCGPKEAHDSFTSYLRQKNNAGAVEESLKRFEGLYPYLAAIAEKTGKHFTDYDVVEAYWVGNKNLGLFSRDDMKKIIAALVKRGLPAAVAESRIKNLPKGMLPHHNFHAFYIGVGQVTGTVPTTLATMDDCMIIEGSVEKVAGEKLLVRRKHLAKSGNRLALTAENTVEAAYMKELLPNVKKGDKVALHWGFASLILTKQQAESLNRHTNKILGILNSAEAYWPLPPPATASL